eukprot:Opistho-1_new@48018
MAVTAADPATPLTVTVISDHAPAPPGRQERLDLDAVQAACVVGIRKRRQQRDGRRPVRGLEPLPRDRRVPRAARRDRELLQVPVGPEARVVVADLDARDRRRGARGTLDKERVNVALLKIVVARVEPDLVADGPVATVELNVDVGVGARVVEGARVRRDDVVDLHAAANLRGRRRVHLEARGEREVREGRGRRVKELGGHVLGVLERVPRARLEQHLVELERVAPLERQLEPQDLPVRPFDAGLGVDEEFGLVGLRRQGQGNARDEPKVRTEKVDARRPDADPDLRRQLGDALEGRGQRERRHGDLAVARRREPAVEDRLEPPAVRLVVRHAKLDEPLGLEPVVKLDLAVEIDDGLQVVAGDEADRDGHGPRGKRDGPERDLARVEKFTRAWASAP